MTRDAERINYPEMRKDLIFSRQQAAGETCFIVKDPVRGNYFRFREAERFIIEQFDGETSLETIRQRAEEEFGATLPMETLRGFVLNLSKTGVLETGKQEETSSRSRRKQRVRGNLLYLRFQAFDPDRLFTRLAQKVWFFHTPHFVIFSAALILAAMGVAITHWSEISQDVDRLYQVSAIPLVMLTVCVVVAAHEFAHGLTCKHFGGEVHEVGFMLVYFQPAFYCNVSDAWLFPEKSRRLWVGFAGPFFELFLWAIATFLWLITDADTLINFISLIVMASSGVKTLLNFNPLIKLDGYYLLSDYLEMPNLRKRAFQYVGDGIKRLFGRPVGEIESPAPRERRIYLIYGLIATVASFSLLLLVSVQAGKALIENNQPFLLALLVVFVSLKLRLRLLRLFSRSGGPDDEEELASPANGASTAVSDVASEEKSENRYLPAPAENKALEKHSSNKALEKRPSEEIAENSAIEKRSPAELVGKSEKLVRRSSQGLGRPGKSRRRSWKRPICWGVILGAIPVILYFGKMEHRITGYFNVLPVRSADVRADIEGIIETITVNEGDQVREGDLIARISDKDLRPELAQTVALIQQTQAKLRMQEAGATAMEIEVAKSAVARAEESLKYARGHAGRNQQLFNEQIISRKELETTQELVALAENQLVEANSKLNVVLQGTRLEEIAATKSVIEGLETQRRHLEDQLRRLNIYSATSGIIGTPARQLKELRRQLAKKGDLIAKIYDPESMTAEIVISEKEITDVKVGQKVSLKALTYPDMTFEGTVTAIGVAAQGWEQPSSSSSSSGAASLSRHGSASRTILVTTQLDNSSHLLKPEMTGHAKVQCGQRRLIDLLRWRLARVIKVEFWSWW
jgi:putative peptide zinc metalloprotease protein